MQLRRRLLLQTYQLGDLLVMAGSFVLAAWWVAGKGGGPSLTELFAIRLKVGNFALFLALMLVWHLLFSGYGLYRSRRLSPRRSEVVDVVKATSLGSVAMLNVGWLFGVQLFEPRLVAIFWIVATAATVASRLLLRRLLVQVRLRGRNLRNVLVVGTNPRARSFASRLEASPGLGYRVIGFVDDDWVGLADFERAGGRLLAGFGDLFEFLRGNVVDEVVIGLPLSSCYHQCERVVRRCELQGITVRFLSDIFNLSLARAKVDSFQEEPVITLETARIDGWPALLKRGVDLAASTVLLIALAPLFALVAALIKATTPGPVFFVQERVGLGKRRFRVFKFRTMVADAERRQRTIEHLNEVGGPVFKIARDPRITPLGAVLRKTSVDELPQLFNVFLGDMSLVGPRPLPVRDYEGFDQDWHRRRFSVRPGITCLWQIRGRSGIPFERWMELDMEYIDRWSLLLDLKILVRTIPAVLKGTGAA